MKTLSRLKLTLFSVGVAMIAGALFSPGFATRTFARPPLVITGTPTIVVTLTPTLPTPTTPVRTEPGPCVNPYVRKSSSVIQAMVGDTVEFTIVVANSCPADAVNVQVRDTLPDYLDLISVSASPRGTVIQSGNTFIVDIGTLAAAEVITIQAVGRMNDKTPEGTCANVATLNTTSEGDNPNDNISMVTWVCGPPPLIPPAGGDGVDVSSATHLTLALGAMLIAISLFIRRQKPA